MKNLKTVLLAGLLVWMRLISTASLAPAVGPRSFASDSAFLDYVQRQTFRFFWEEANPANGLVRDRSRAGSPCSIASVGFGLSAIPIGIERGWIERGEGAQRVLKTLQTLWTLPEGSGACGFAGCRGWFYHFLDMDTGLRAPGSELSTIDTALLMMGVIESGQFFNSATNPSELQIRQLADELVGRIDWSFMLRTNDLAIGMEWTPERGYGGARWVGYNEASCLYLLALGTGASGVPAGLWDSWTHGYRWEKEGGDNGFVLSPSLFTHQYSQVWIDFRGIADAYMRARQSDYFENSRRATLAQQHYGLENPLKFPNYGAQEWGFTACDGPGRSINGVWYSGYRERGAPGGFEDGTIAPTAAAGSLPFAPEICLSALRHLYDAYSTNLWTSEGFRDAYNIRAGWWAEDAIGIDQGPIVVMLENYRSGATWSRMLASPIIQRGLERAGFTAPPPDRLSARALGPNQMELVWHDNSAYETGFRVESSTNGVQFHLAAEVGANITRVSLPVAPGTRYQFRVRTTSAAGLSGYRETLNADAAPRGVRPSSVAAMSVGRGSLE